MKRPYTPPTVESSGPWLGIESEANAFECHDNDLWRGPDYDPQPLRALLRRAMVAGMLAERRRSVVRATYRIASKPR